MIIITLIVLCLLSMMVSLWLLKKKRMTMPFLYQHNPGYTLGVVLTDNPLQIDVNEIDVLHKQQFHLHPEPTIMADPFIVCASNSGGGNKLIISILSFTRNCALNTDTLLEQI